MVPYCLTCAFTGIIRNLVKKDQNHKLTYQILIGMLAGVIVGIIINIITDKNAGTVSTFIDDKITEGLFYLVGQVFLGLLQVLVVPLVMVSLICGTAALGDVKRLGRIGLHTFFLYILTTGLAISFALTASVLVGPGRGFGLTTASTFEAPAPRDD